MAQGIEWRLVSNKVINDTLQDFIKKYGKKLEYLEVNNVLDTSDASASLRSVLVSFLYFFAITIALNVLLMCHLYAKKLADKFGHALSLE